MPDGAPTSVQPTTTATSGAGIVDPTEEERRIIAEADKRRAEQKKIPPGQRRYHPRPERFDFPIGLDDEGRPFPVHERGRDTGPDDDAGDGHHHG